MHCLTRYLVFAALVAFLASRSGAVAAEHPMDPLSADEIAAAVEVLRTGGKLQPGAKFPMVRLEEMPKAEELKWNPGDPISRRAELTIFQNGVISRAVVDLDSRSVSNWKDYPNAMLGMQFYEFFTLTSMVKADTRWQEAMHKRGFEAFDQLICLPFSTGYFGNEAERGHRLFRVGTFFAGNGKNYWARPVSNVIALVDLTDRKVVEVLDSGPVPVPAGPGDYDAASQPSLRPEKPGLEIQETEGEKSYTIEGHVVTWDNWQFHVRMDPQVGLVLSNVKWKQNGRWRSVMYEGSLSELFVPYMDPSPDWYFRTYLDAGEYLVGESASPLIRGSDCPKSATLLDVVLGNTSGRAQNKKQVIAIFERPTGDSAWRHLDQITGSLEGRSARELVVRSISTLGNYDYLFDWIFTTAGDLRIRVGATGIDAAKAVAPATALQDQEGAAKFGRFVAEHVVAVNHDHFLAFRLDLDIDGEANSFERDGLVPTRFQPTPQSPRTSGWIVNPSIAATENDAKMKIRLDKPMLWRIINPEVKNAWGNPVSYHIKPGANVYSLMDPEDWPQKRAAFVAYNLWVTPYEADERFAGGDFPNQSDGSDGLAVWASKNRAIEDADIVVWYTLGFHHVVRAEDWPVMPTSWHEFTLRPYDFFDRNPALDLAPDR